jgi:hypothetical protein
MTTSSYIPSGQTSLVKKGKVALQVQTEYSPRPYPRIKTTIFNAGRVVHKIEKKLDRSIESVEEHNRVEGVMKHQHREVVSIIQETSSLSAMQFGPVLPVGELSTEDRLAALPGVDRVFHLDRYGKFLGQNNCDLFRKAFAAVYKGLPVIMDVFTRLPGSSFRREKGVYEVERNRLYFTSAGEEFYFVLIRRAAPGVDYEKSLKEVMCPAEEF